MSYPVPIISTSQFVTVGAAEVDFAALMEAQSVAGLVYEFVSSTNCYIKQGAAAGSTAASAGAGSKFCAAGVPVYIDPKYGRNLSVIQASAGGTATLTKLAFRR